MILNQRKKNWKIFFLNKMGMGYHDEDLYDEDLYDEDLYFIKQNKAIALLIYNQISKL